MLPVMKCLFLSSVLMFIASLVYGDPAQSVSHVGYLFPAGAQQGTTLEITAGGRSLRGMKEIFVTGEGVEATYVLTVPNYKKTYGDYIRQLQKELRQKESIKNRKGKKSRANKKQKEKQDKIVPPDHPIFRNLKKCSSKQLAVLLRRYYKENKQKTRELDELVLIKVKVAHDAKPGMREVRLRTNNGISNPMRFFVGEKLEVIEREPNDQEADDTSLAPPFIINGQIAAGDIDRFKFKAKAGQQLLIQGHARSVIPYIADAVPGWFQATLALYDASGKELAYADDYRFSPDPILFYKIPSDGLYTLEMRDSIYRGREDFVYRISVGQDPYITHIFPLGGQQGRNPKVSLSGWNLTAKHLALNTDKDPGTRQQIGLGYSNLVPYAVDELPEVFEKPDNNSLEKAQLIATPVVINGRIESPEDRDVFRFNARPGDEIVAEVNARRLHSPMDSMLKLTDSKGSVIAWNDDTEQLNLGMLTHHADSKLSTRLPKEGAYFIHLSDTQNQGGEEYGYRLRISRPIPDFSLSATPSSITVRRGCSVPITVHVVRKDGFDGVIDIVLKDTPKGFKLSGATIPSGRNSVRMTLTAPVDAKNKSFQIRLQGRSKLERRSVIRDVTPCEAMTQAFITQHIVPSQQLMVYVGGWGEAPEVVLSKSGRLSIPRGGETTVRIKKTKSSENLRLKLYEAPEGVSMEQKRSGNNSMSVSLKVDDQMKVGTAGNLMIEVFREQKTKGKKTRLQSMGVMPAVPFIVE